MTGSVSDSTISSILDFLRPLFSGSISSLYGSLYYKIPMSRLRIPRIWRQNLKKNRGCVERSQDPFLTFTLAVPHVKCQK